jgi:hypothetical protein
VTRRTLTTRHEPEDILPGDWVRRLGFAGAGLVESVKGDHAVVTWSKGRRDILPFAALIRVEPRGHNLDRKPE